MIYHRTLILVTFVAIVGRCNVAAPNASEAPPVVAVATPSPSPVEKRLTEVDLTINGVRIGASEAEVFKLLGKPDKIRKGGFDNCAYGYHRYLIYNGLTIDLLSDEDRRNYSVTRMEVTSEKWEIAPGVRIGDTMIKVRETFGDPVTESPTRLSFVTKDNDGWVSFDSKDGKLIRAAVTVTLC